MEKKLTGIELSEAQMEQVAGGWDDILDHVYILCNGCKQRIYVHTYADTARCLCPHCNQLTEGKVLRERRRD